MQISKKIYTTLIIAVLTMSAIMAAIPMASAEITVAPTLAPTSGPVGTEINVSATAAGAASPFATVTAYLDSLSGVVLGHGSATNTGAYSFNVTIPATTAGDHFIVVNDGETESNGTIFTVTPRITVSVTRALPGDSVAVSGTGFGGTRSVALILNSTTLATANTVTLSTSPTTNATGSFATTFVVPAMNTSVYDVYTLIANDTLGNNANTTLTIDYYIMLTPAVGPTGITTTISGRIVANTAYQLTFNGAGIATGTTSSDGSYTFAYTIPNVLGTGTYPVAIVWATVNNRTASFTVTPSPTISINPITGFAGATVAITGSGFSGKADVTLYFGSTVVNNTAGGFGPTTAGGAIPTGSTFVVPALAPGIYAVSVVDQYGATSASGIYFTITATPVTQVNINANEYYPMDIISFSIYTTDNFTSGPTVTVRDPSGVTVWMGAWTLTATGVNTWRMLYMNEMINGNYMQLASDCPLGTWNWTITYTAAVAGAKKATGLFNVVEMPSMQTVLDRLDELDASITDVITTTENDIIAVINTKTGTIMTSLSNLDVSAQLTSIDNGIATISTTLGDVQTSIDSLSMDALGADITSIKNGVATIQTNLGTVNTAVSNLAAKVTDIQGDVATVLTNLGTLDGKVTAIDGKVATVETDVGTIQADVSDVQAKADQTPVWIAVVLSLVAAIAAIFAVITIRQKIAG